MRTFKLLLSLSLLILPASIAFAAVDFNQWPKPADAREFTRLDDKLPAVLSYFSRESQQQIKQLYLEQLGQPLTERNRYGQLELHYHSSGQHGEQVLRIIISEQRDWRQVDLMVQARHD